MEVRRVHSRSVSISDSWPAGFSQGTITPSQGTCTTGPNFTCALGTVESGRTHTGTAITTLPGMPTGDQTNTATVSSSTTDPETGNNTASDTDTVTTSANLSISMTDGETAVTAGDWSSNTSPTTVIYTLSLHDALPIFSDSWPAGFSQGTITPSQGTCTTGPNFTCALGTV